MTSVCKTDVFPTRLTAHFDNSIAAILFYPIISLGTNPRFAGVTQSSVWLAALLWCEPPFKASHIPIAVANFLYSAQGLHSVHRRAAMGRIVKLGQWASNPQRLG